MVSFTKNIFLSLFLFIPLTANSLEYVYKELVLDIPDCEVTGGGIANIKPYDTLFLSGKNWSMGLGDSGFIKDCAFAENIDNSISCDEQNRIQMLDRITKENTTAARVLFSAQSDDKIKRQEFLNYILYSSASLNKYSVAILVEKLTGKTVVITGKFNDKHLNWLRLEPL